MTARGCAVFSAVSSLPQPGSLAYAIRWNNPWERDPRNSKTRLRAGPAIFGDTGKLAPIAVLRKSEIALCRRVPQALSGRAGNVRPEAASSRVAAGPSRAWTDATRRA